MRANLRRSRASPPGRGLWLGLLITALLLSAAAMGCGSTRRGTYPVEVFSEMHYSQSFRSQESPRLYPVVGSVPFIPEGIEPLVVQEPAPPARTAATVAQGKDLFRVNCVVCHGASGKGDGPMKDFLVKWGGVPPADITGATTRGSSDAEILSFVGEGGRIGLFSSLAGVESLSTMPTFKKLLMDEELWKLVYYLRELQSQ